MANEVQLNAGIRSNLLLLQNVSVNLQKTQLRGPRRRARQKDNPTGLHARQATLAAQGIREWLAQLTIQCIERARATDERRDGAAFTDFFRGRARLRRSGRRLHGKNLSGRQDDA